MLGISLWSKRLCVFRGHDEIAQMVVVPFRMVLVNENAHADANVIKLVQNPHEQIGFRLVATDCQRHPDE